MQGVFHQLLNLVKGSNNIYGIINDGKVSEIVNVFLGYAELSANPELAYFLMSNNRGLLVTMISTSLLGNEDSVRVLKNVVDMAKCIKEVKKIKIKNVFSKCTTAVGNTVVDAVSDYMSVYYFRENEAAFNELRRHQSFYLLATHMVNQNFTRKSFLSSFLKDELKKSH